MKIFSLLRNAFKQIFYTIPREAVCNHKYCYRYTICTKCGKRYSGKSEPEYTPHFMVNGKLTPRE